MNIMVDACRKSFATEGVTLSGFRKDEDCKPIGLWRIPFDGCRRCKARGANLSGKRTKFFPEFKGEVFVFLQVAQGVQSAFYFL